MLFKEKFVLLIAAVLLVLLSACGKTASVLNSSIYHDLENGGIYIKQNIDDFTALGFNYGDSVEVTFSNGYKLDEIPFYNGFYAKVGEAMLIGYPGEENIKVCICFGDDLWDVSKVKETDTVSIKKKKSGKYLKEQKALNLEYTEERNDYNSDEEYANFRNVKVGRIKEGILYRGSSPIDNKISRAKYSDELIEKAKIKYIVDLSDDKEELKEHFASNDFESDYFKSLYENGKVGVYDVNMNYTSKEFAEQMVKAMTDMANNEGPYYIHCIEGKDRTGFFCVLIEGLAGASYEEIVNDYMITYKNFYGIDEKNERERYNVIKEHYLDTMLRFLANYGGNTGNEDIPLSGLEYTNIIGRYLNDNGMSIKEIGKWYDKVTDQN